MEPVSQKKRHHPCTDQTGWNLPTWVEQRNTPPLFNYNQLHEEFLGCQTIRLCSHCGSAGHSSLRELVVGRLERNRVPISQVPQYPTSHRQEIGRDTAERTRDGSVARTAHGDGSLSQHTNLVWGIGRRDKKNMPGFCQFAVDTWIAHNSN